MATPTREREVVGPAGGKFTVITDDEEDLFLDLARRYLTDNHFTNVSDLVDLERVIHMEVMHLRYSNWMSTEEDYFGERVDPKTLGAMLKDLSMELRQLKKAIGIDRTSRQRDTGETVADYWQKLQERAAEFGVMRENQLTAALTLFNDLMAFVTLHDNCTPQEREDQDCEMEDIFKWLREVAFPEYLEIDKHFIDNEQRYWVQQQ